jgi:hypothetical protein
MTPVNWKAVAEQCALAQTKVIAVGIYEQAHTQDLKYIAMLDRAKISMLQKKGATRTREIKNVFPS